MPTFLLIDHSAQDTTGHHYEYAMRVLDAAAKAGYTPVFGANICFQSSSPIPFRVYPVYPDGFWPRMARARTSVWVVETILKLASQFRLLRFRVFFSRLGFLWLIRNEPVGYIKWHPFDSAISGRLLVFAGLPGFFVRWFGSLVLAIVPFRGYFSHLAAAIWAPIRFLVTHLADFLSPAGSMASWRFARRKEKSFGKATLRVLQSLQLGADDIVFIPTLAEPEMLGLSRCFEKYSRSGLPSYHLLFRRNLYEGREPDFDRQEEAILPIRNAFLHFKSLLSGHKVYFYTDTEELSSQFGRLKIFPFRTCPIPHTAPASEHEPITQPLQITYLGDARAEKGYQHLPGVVQDFWRSEVQTGKVSFALQSNYNVHPGEPAAVVARSQLSAYPSEKVRLITETCTSDEYRRTLMSAAVVVLPYRADLYYARSSGVLIEALAAGIPVVTPAASWLAKQIADPAHEYLDRLAQQGGAAAARRHRWLRDNLGGDGIVNSSTILSIGGESRGVHTSVAVPAAASHILIGFHVDHRPGLFVTCCVDQLDRGGRRVAFSRNVIGPGYSSRTVRVALPVHSRARQVWISLRNAFSSSVITIHDPDIRFLSVDGGSVPLSAVGVTFSEDTSKAISDALREVLCHYQHYRETAICHSKEVFRFHNAANLVQLLTSTGKGQAHSAEA